MPNDDSIDETLAKAPSSAPTEEKNPPNTLVRSPTDDAKANDPLIGTEFVGKYLIKQVLGRGGMGVVYLAEHQLMRRKVAIKVLLTRMLDDESSRKRFEQEARIASQLSHPNAVTLHDFGVESGLPYLVMEYVEGSTLKSLLKKEGALSVARTIALLSQLEGALSQAHRLGIVHRDLKPDNIILANSDSGEEVPKILDFGISKAVQSSENLGAEDTGLTQTGMVIGTPRYLAPEQARGEAVDQRSDVYSLGIMTYEMLSGKGPFSEGTVLEVIAQHLHTEPPKLSDVAKNISPEVTAVVASALAKQPADRPPSVEAFVEALRQASKTKSLGLWLGLGFSLLLVFAALFFFQDKFTGNQEVILDTLPDLVAELVVVDEQEEPKEAAPVEVEVAEESATSAPSNVEVPAPIEAEVSAPEQELQPAEEALPTPSPQETVATPPLVEPRAEEKKVPSGYYIQLREFENESAAEDLVRDFDGTKFRAYYEENIVFGKTKYVVFVGRFESMFSAMSEAKEVAKVAGVSDKVTTVKQK